MNLGLEKVELEDKEAQADIQKSFDVDKSRYLGMHGTAVLSRYPILKATLRPLPVCYDWYASEKKAISKLESGRRAGANLAFMERIAREIRRGGRTVLFVELAVPESPTGAVTVVAPHLENKCKSGCRAKQAAQVLECIRGDHNPIILGRDLKHHRYGQRSGVGLQGVRGSRQGSRQVGHQRCQMVYGRATNEKLEEGQT